MKQALVTQHLALLGLLESRDTNAIAEAKRIFWADRRLQLRALSRKKRKSIQVFFSIEEFDELNHAAHKVDESKTAYVREAALFEMRKTTALRRSSLMTLRGKAFETLRNVEMIHAANADHIQITLEEFIQLITAFIKSLQSYDN